MTPRFRSLPILALLVAACDDAATPPPTGPDLARVPAPPAEAPVLSAALAAADRVDLEWSLTDDASEYRVERRRSISAAAGWVQIAATAARDTSLSDEGLGPAVVYEYRVRGCNEGGCSPYSNAQSFTTPMGSWNVLSIGSFVSDISGADRNAVFAAGFTALRFDGSAWHDISQSALWEEPFFEDVWMAPDGTPYGLLPCGPVVRHDGMEWSIVDPPFNQFSVGQELNRPLQRAFDLRPLCWFYWALWGTPDQQILLSGEFGQVAHFDGQTWQSNMPGPFNEFVYELNDVWGTSVDDYWVVGGDFWGYTGMHNGTIMHWNGATWHTIVSALDPVAPILNAVWGSSSTDVFAVGGGSIFHYDGVTLTETTAPALNTIWGSGPSDVYAGGSTVLLHYDGVSWTPIDPSLASGAASIWMTPGGDQLFIAGGTSIRWGTPPAGLP